MARWSTASALLTMAVLLTAPTTLYAEWQIKPFVGLTFAGSTTLLNLDQAADDTNAAYGISGWLIGEVFGVEVDVGRTPGFFQSGKQLVLRSSATSVTGNLVIAVPRRIAAYALRPYAVAGGGITTAHEQLAVNPSGVLEFTDRRSALDVGGGVTGFLTTRVGVSWDVRHFRTLGAGPGTRGNSVGPEKLSFWRANMALAIRY